LRHLGDLVQVDTLQARLLPDGARFQFIARDTITRFDGLRAIQIDGGSEFKEQFEAAGRRRKILLFVNAPHCPEMNGPHRIICCGRKTSTTKCHRCPDPVDTEALTPFRF
jgi:hypothetical protein